MAHKYTVKVTIKSATRKQAMAALDEAKAALRQCKNGYTDELSAGATAYYKLDIEKE